MSKQEELARLSILRRARDAEFRRFLAQPALREILNRFVSFLTDESAEKLRLNITAGSDSFTDGKTITVGLPELFFDPDYVSADWVTLFKALLAHEVQHVNSSNFDDITQIGEDYAKLMEPRGIPKNVAENIAKEFLNIMEDSRIENIIIHKYPGFRMAFLLLNNAIRQYSGPEEVATSPGQEFLDFRGNALSYAITGRLAPNVEIYAGSRLEHEFQAVQHFFDQAVDARTSKDCREVCMKMLETSADYFAELLKSQQAQDDATGGMSSDAEYTSNGEREYNSPNPAQTGGSRSIAMSVGTPGEGSDSSDDSPAPGETSAMNGKKSKGKGTPGKDGQGNGGSGSEGSETAAGDEKDSSASGDKTGEEAGKENEPVETSTMGGKRSKEKDTPGKDGQGDGGSGSEGSETAAGDEKDSSASGDKASEGAGKENEPGEGRGSSDHDSDVGGKGASGRSRDGQNSLRTRQDHIDPYAPWTDDFSDYGHEEYVLVGVTAEDLALMRQGVRDEYESVENPRKTKEDEKEVKEKQAMQDITEQYASESIRTFEEIFPKINDSELPREIAHDAKKLERDFERILRQKRSQRRHLRMGRLDSRSLYRFGLHDPNLFMRKGQPMKADMAVFLLLDNSGSMMCVGAEMEVDGKPHSFSKSNLSRIAAAVIEAALSKFAAIKISLFDVSYSSIRHATIKKFDEKSRGSRAYNSISTVGIGDGNKDGFSIRVATKDLLARREQKKVLLILSDGLPSDYDEGELAGMEDVQSAVKEARRKGIIVIPIMFGDSFFREEMTENFTFMYEKFISCDPAAIAEEFKKLFINLVKQS